MKWMKNNLLDLLLTVLILIAVAGNVDWLMVVIIVYSSLVLLLRVVVLFNADMMHMVYKRMPDMPSWPLHLLYAINVFILSAGQQFLIAGLWLLIWLLSWLGERKATSSGAKNSSAGR